LKLAIMRARRSPARRLGIITACISFRHFMPSLAPQMLRK